MTACYCTGATAPLQWHDLICTPAGVEGNLGGMPDEQAVSDGIGEIRL